MRDPECPSWSGPELTKRQFMIGIGASAVGAMAGRAALAADDAAQFDLIVVGAGTAGVPAAIFASRRGAKVLLVDVAPQMGGTLLIAHGQMSAAGTKVQQAKGIHDTPQMHFDDIWRISKGTVNPDLVKLAVFNAAEAFDWLMDNGFEMRPEHPVRGRAHEMYSEDRYYWGIENGVSIVKVLQQQVAPEIHSGRVTFLPRTAVKELIFGDSGAVTGIVAESDDGTMTRYGGRSVLLASGGYAANVEMFERLSGVRHYARMSYPYCQGDGITMGLAAGGYLRGKEHYLCNFGAIMGSDEPQSVAIARFNTYPERRMPWEIYVNARGERFIREDHPSVDAREHALLKQPDFRFWIVFDDEIMKSSPLPIEGWDRQRYAAAFDAEAMFARGRTLGELATKIGVDAGGLENTITAYNQAQKSGDDVLGRRYMPRPVQKGPFYAIRHQGYSISSTSGLAVDPKLQVIRSDGSPIENLYAAGEIIGTAQLMGNSVCGGMNVMPAITFGKLLGAQMIPIGA